MAGYHFSDDVLLRVFRVAMCDESRDTFKHGLQLLAVCRRWRQLALGTVYRSLFLAVHEKDNWTKYLPVRVRVETNLKLAAAAGAVHSVREIHIKLNCRRDTINGIRKAAEMLRAAATEWPGVWTLTIASQVHNSPQRVDEDARTGSLCAALARLLPGMRRLVYQRGNNMEHARGVFERLATITAGRLHDLECRGTAYPPPDDRFAQLRNAYFNCAGMERRLLPHIDTTRLVKLALYDASPWLAWAPFSNSNGSSLDIEFPALQFLCLEFWQAGDGHDRAGDRSDERVWRLHFPQLRSASINCQPDVCPSLGFLVLPRRMDRLRLRGPPALLSAFANVEMPAARQLHLYVAPGGTAEPRALAHVSRITAGAHLCDEALLSIGCNTMVVRPSDLACTGLTELSIAAPISVDAIVELLEILPRLSNLTLGNVDIGPGQNVLAVPEPSTHVPLNTSLQQLAICFDAGYRLTEQAAVVAKFLLLTIPSLERFSATNVLPEPVLAFAREYSQWYPHLTTVDIRCWS
ncbi:hypothetical protein H4R19_001865 [Coemansia spiralis]|nr:hypothetical protein H4R19_001865 [Coemansia spiralis]